MRTLSFSHLFATSALAHVHYPRDAHTADASMLTVMEPPEPPRFAATGGWSYASLAPGPWQWARPGRRSYMTDKRPLKQKKARRLARKNRKRNHR